MALNVMTIDEINEVPGAEAPIWHENEFFRGFAMFSLGIGIAAAPVGLFGVGVATGLSYFGGSFMGDGYWNGGLRV